MLSVFRQHDRDEAAEPDQSAGDIAVAVKGLARMGMELPDHLQPVRVRRFDHLPHGGGVNMEAATRRARDRAEHAQRDTCETVGLAQQVDNSLVAARGFWRERSEEHTSELQSLMRISYAVLCLKTK